MEIEKKLTALRQLIPEEVTLVAVSKTKPLSDIEAAYAAGQRVFGENKVQEMTAKWEALPKDIEWHMIGHLQRNKVKYMAPYVALIHGVDSGRLLREINKQAEKNNRVIDCLLQIHIAEESTKFGFDTSELQQLVEELSANPLPHVSIKGVMGMATFTQDETQIRKEFRTLKHHYDNLRQNFETMNILSMGMSGDFEIAIEEGSSMIRVGSKIFGERN